MAKLISKSARKSISKKSSRQKLKEKFGSKAFLDPENLRYPIYDSKGLNCGMVYSAYIRAKQHHENKIAEKAKNIFKRNGCEDRIHRKIREELINIIEELLEII